MDEGRAHLDGLHPAFPGEKTRQRDFQLAVGKEEDGFAVQRLGRLRDGLAGAGARRSGHFVKQCGAHVEFRRNGRQPLRRAFFAEGERGRDVPGTPARQRVMRIAEEWLCQRIDGARADTQILVRTRGGQHLDGADAHGLEQADGLFLNDVRQSADQQKLTCFHLRQNRHHGGQTGILALGEGGFDPGAGEVQDAHRRRVALGHPLGRLGEVQLDHLGRAGSHEEELPDVRAAGEQFVHNLVKFRLRICEAGKIRFLQNGRAKARFGKNHHAGGGLQQMRAGPRANHQKERVLHLAVQPDDSRQTAEHFALTALFENRCFAATAACGEAWQFGHAVTSGIAAACNRAARSFSTNCAALMT